MAVSEVRKALFQAKSAWTASEHEGHGFYAIFLKKGGKLPGIDVPEDGLIYVGKTETGFHQRDHFAPPKGHSGYCTLRRSLGAVLKHQLRLAARPRSGLYDRKSTFLNYRFDDAGEERLSEWMKSNLQIARIPFENQVAMAEKMMIDLFLPPLNLKGVHTATSKQVKALRRVCFEEARDFARAKLAA